MKIKTILLFTLLLAFCVSAQAQFHGGKPHSGKKPGAHNTTHLTKTKKGKSRPRTNATYYKWPKTMSREISTHIGNGTFGQTIQLEKTVQRAAHSHYQNFISYPLEMETLHFVNQENAFYEPEINTARLLYKDIRGIRLLTTDLRTHLQDQINTLNDQSLQNILSSDLQSGNLHQMAQDVSDYYALDGDMVRSSYNYLLRYPHNPSLPYRRALRNPLIDPSLRATAARFLEKATLNGDDQALLHDILDQMHIQRLARTKAAKEVSDPLITASLDFYQNTTQALEHFIHTNNRLPKSSATTPEEAQLYQDIAEARHRQESAAAPQEILRAHERLEEVWRNGEYQADLVSYQRTYQSLQKFVAANGRRPKWNTLDQEEFSLYQEISLIFGRKDHATQHPGLWQTYQDVKAVWDNSAPQFWSYEEMLRRYEEHGRTTGEWGLPPSLRQNPDLTPEQIEFYDNVEHYLFASHKTSHDLQDIQNKYNSAE